LTLKWRLIACQMFKVLHPANSEQEIVFRGNCRHLRNSMALLSALDGRPILLRTHSVNTNVMVTGRSLWRIPWPFMPATRRCPGVAWEPRQFCSSLNVSLGLRNGPSSIEMTAPRHLTDRTSGQS
jgi:hypothetical protein